VSGTLAMNMPLADKQQLQAKTALETLRHLDRQKLPETRQFASPRQMLDCISRDDLAGLAAGGFAGAQEELDFRNAVTAAVVRLEQTATDAKPDALATGPVRDALDALNGLAGGDVDRQGFVARELNRSGKLDPLLTLAKSAGVKGLAVLDAGIAVADALDAKAHAQTILREVVYPKMVKEKPNGVDGTLLSQMDAILRAAQLPDDVDDALDIGIAHFQKRTGLLGRPRDAAFAAELGEYKMRVA
jgi:hypothetical protein